MTEINGAAASYSGSTVQVSPGDTIKLKTDFSSGGPDLIINLYSPITGSIIPDGAKVGFTYVSSSKNGVADSTATTTHTNLRDSAYAEITLKVSDTPTITSIGLHAETRAGDTDQLNDPTQYQENSDTLTLNIVAATKALPTPTISAKKIVHNDKEIDYSDSKPIYNGDSVKFDTTFAVGTAETASDFELVYNPPTDSKGNLQGTVTDTGKVGTATISTDKKTVTWTGLKVADTVSFTLKVNSDLDITTPSIAISDYTKATSGSDTKVSNIVTLSLWAMITGTVNGPYSSVSGTTSTRHTLPGITVTSNKEDNSLLYGAEPSSSSSTGYSSADIVTSDDSGIYEVPISKNSTNKKIKLTFFLYDKITDNPNYAFQNQDGSNVYFRTESLDISSTSPLLNKTTGKFKRDINLNKTGPDPKWDAPTASAAIYQNLALAEVWYNLYSGWKKSNDLLSVSLTDLITVKIDPSFVEENTSEAKTSSYVAGNKIYMRNDDLYTLSNGIHSLFSTRYSFPEFHQFGHILVEKAYGGKMTVPQVSDFILNPVIVNGETIKPVKNPATRINFSHGGYLNDYTTDSLLEGMSQMISLELYNNVDAPADSTGKIQKGYRITKANGDLLNSLIIPAALFSQYSSAAKPQVSEGDVIAKLIYTLINGTNQTYSTGDTTGTLKTYANTSIKQYEFLGQKLDLEFNYSLSYSPDASKNISLKNLLGYMKDKKIVTLQELFIYLKCTWQIGQTTYNKLSLVGNYGSLFTPIIAALTQANMINPLDQLFVLFGAFHDDSADNHYDWGEPVGGLLGSGAYGNVKKIDSATYYDSSGNKQTSPLYRRDWRK